RWRWNRWLLALGNGVLDRCKVIIHRGVTRTGWEGVSRNRWRWILAPGVDVRLQKTLHIQFLLRVHVFRVQRNVKCKLGNIACRIHRARLFHAWLVLPVKHLAAANGIAAFGANRTVSRS